APHTGCGLVRVRRSRPPRPGRHPRRLARDDSAPARRPRPGRHAPAATAAPRPRRLGTLRSLPIILAVSSKFVLVFFKKAANLLRRPLFRVLQPPGVTALLGRWARRPTVRNLLPRCLLVTRTRPPAILRQLRRRTASPDPPAWGASSSGPA